MFLLNNILLNIYRYIQCVLTKSISHSLTSISSSMLYPFSFLTLLSFSQQRCPLSAACMCMGEIICWSMESLSGSTIFLLILPFPSVISYQQLHVRVEPHQPLPQPCWDFDWLNLGQVLGMHPSCCDVTCKQVCHQVQQYCFAADVSSLWPLQYSYPLFHNDPQALGADSLIQMSHLQVNTPVSYSLHIDWLWVSVLISIYYKKTLLSLRRTERCTNIWV